MIKLVLDLIVRADWFPNSNSLLVGSKLMQINTKYITLFDYSLHNDHHDQLRKPRKYPLT